LGNKIEIIKPNPQTIRVVQTRGIIKGMVSSRKRRSTIQIISILIIRLKRPKVNSLKGRVIKLRSGFKKKFKRPKIKPAKKRLLILPANSTPGTN
jgi:hypothetical protein